MVDGSIRMGHPPPTYVEQARQTILAGAKEAVLFCYGSLLRENGPENIEAFRNELPELYQLAELIHEKPIRGISAPKPPNSNSKDDRYVFDFIGMLGLPLVPTTTVREDAAALFLSEHALKETKLIEKVNRIVASGKPILMTERLARRLPKSSITKPDNVLTIDIPKDHWELMDLPVERLGEIRTKLLEPFGLEFEAPSRVSLYLFGEDLVAIENFNDDSVTATLKTNNSLQPNMALVIPQGDVPFTATPGAAKVEIPPRSLTVFEFVR